MILILIQNENRESAFNCLFAFITILLQLHLQSTNYKGRGKEKQKSPHGSITTLKT